MKTIEFLDAAMTLTKAYGELQLFKAEQLHKLKLEAIEAGIYMDDYSMVIKRNRLDDNVSDTYVHIAGQVAELAKVFETHKMTFMQEGYCGFAHSTLMEVETLVAQGI